MKINLYHPKTGELRRIHHHDVQGWIDDGFLTSPPVFEPVATEEPESIAPKPKAKKSAPVESE
jgi:hypothetical protein